MEASTCRFLPYVNPKPPNLNPSPGLLLRLLFLLLFFAIPHPHSFERKNK
jgi:hypothetical protein